jgi:hypothetical protein
MEVLHPPVRPAYQRFYRAAGRSLCVETSDEWSAHLLEQFFAGWHLAPSTRDAELSACALIRVRSGESPPTLRSGLETFEVAAGGLCHTDGEMYYFEESGSLTVVHPGPRGCVEVWIGDSTESKSPAPLARLIFNAALAAMRRSGLYELHGGGVVEPSGGRGVLFVGPSGSGKSTLTMQLAAAGWKYLSDDSLLLSEGQEGIEARGLRRAFSLTEKTIAATGWAELNSMTSAPVPFDPLKRRFEPQELFPSGFAEASLPGALFFPSVTHERESRLHQLTQFEAMERLLKMSPWACYDKPSAREHIAALSHLARQCVSYELYAGNDLLGDPARTAAFLSPRVKGGRQ